MIIYLVGMSCVGTTTIGRMLAEKLGFSFFDVDEMVQEYYQMPIERIQDECFSMNEFRRKASVVLDNVFMKNVDSVVSGTPAGLKFSYLQVYKKHKKDKTLYSIHVIDSFENVLNRLTFFDKDSNPIIEPMDESKRKWYLQDIKADYRYFESSYNRADFEVNIEDVKLKDIPDLIVEELRQHNIHL
jgi:shikimate kinase